MIPPPDTAALHEAALAHLARYATTEAGLLRVLRRRIRRWAAAARAEAPDADSVAAGIDTAFAAAAAVARRLVEAGLIDDAAFASARAARLARSGRSRRVIAAHLAAKGVDPATASVALAGEGDDWLAAVLFARRRRLGPFRPDADPARHRADLAAFARAGFARSVALKVLALDGTEAAEAALRARR